MQFLYKRKIFPPGAKKPNYFDPEIGIEKVKHGGFAYHTDVPTAYYLIRKTFDNDDICELEEIDFIKAIMLPVVYQKNSPYTKLFARG